MGIRKHKRKHKTLVSTSSTSAMSIINSLSKNGLRIDDAQAIELGSSPESTSTSFSSNLIVGFLNDFISLKKICYHDVYRSYEDYVIFDHISYKLTLSQRVYNAIDACIKNNFELIIVPIGIFSPILGREGHLNIIIIDPKNKTIEYFEPYGHENLFLQTINVAKLIVIQIQQAFTSLQYYTYIDVSQYCIKGLQQFGSQRCGIWCMFILYLRSMNHQFTIHQIEDKLKISAGNNDNLVSLIKRFANMLETRFSKSPGYDYISYNLLDLVNLDVNLTKNLKDYIKTNITEYFQNIIDGKQIVINEKYNFNFYNIIALNNLKQFHECIEQISKEALIKGYNQGNIDGYSRGLQDAKRQIGGLNNENNDDNDDDDLF